MKHKEGYFLLQVSKVADIDTILNGKTYFMNRRPFVVKQWGVGFDFCKEVLKSLSLWVQLHKLLVGLWSADSCTE